MSSNREVLERDRRLQTACLLIITNILVLAVAYQMSAAFIPLVLALFIFQVLDPIVVLLNKKARLPRPLAVTLIIVASIIVVLGASSVLTTSFSELLENSGVYVSQLTKTIEDLSQRFPFIGKRFQHLSQGQVEQFSAEIGSFLAWLTNSLIYLLSQSTVVILFLVFLLLGSSSSSKPLPEVLEDINQTISTYIRVKGALSVTAGLFGGIVLWLLGVKLALVFGLLTMLLNFIPNVGPIIATLLPLPMVLVSPHMSRTEAMLAILLPGIFNFVVGNIIEPRLVGNTLELSPVIILFALAVWTSLWGGIGALLAVPMTAVISILCQRLEFTRPIALILRGNFLELFEPPTKTLAPKEEHPKEGPPQKEATQAREQNPVDEPK